MPDKQTTSARPTAGQRPTLPTGGRYRPLPGPGTAPCIQSPQEE